MMTTQQGQQKKLDCRIYKVIFVIAMGNRAVSGA